MIGPDTKLFLSISARPGRFGATLYNELFRRHSIDALYVPRPAPVGARELVAALRTLEVSGCSVSSPHKSAVPPWLDEVDEAAREADSVNTIVREETGALVGSCTDIDGVEGALRGLRCRTALIYGAGGVVGAAIVALRRLGCERITICARAADRASVKARRFGVACVDLASDMAPKVDVLINATPAGRDRRSPSPLFDLLPHAGALLDMTVSASPTAIVGEARASGMELRDGVDMCTHQLVAQARRYLRREIDLGELREIVERQYLAGAGEPGGVERPA